jgi:hypothetical protein
MSIQGLVVEMLKVGGMFEEKQEEAWGKHSAFSSQHSVTRVLGALAKLTGRALCATVSLKSTSAKGWQMYGTLGRSALGIQSANC